MPCVRQRWCWSHFFSRPQNLYLSAYLYIYYRCVVYTRKCFDDFLLGVPFVIAQNLICNWLTYLKTFHYLCCYSSFLSLTYKHILLLFKSILNQTFLKLNKKVMPNGNPVFLINMILPLSFKSSIINIILTSTSGVVYKNADFVYIKLNVNIHRFKISS